MILRWRAESYWENFGSARLRYARVHGNLYGRAGLVDAMRVIHYRDLLWWYGWC